MADKRPNIILINPDEMRLDTMGHMGNPAAYTPWLDAFARTEAVSFSNCYCQNPVCVPSRCSMFTGLYPHVGGHRTMAHLLQPHETSIFKELHEAGYHVWMNGRNDLVAGQYKGLIASHADEMFYYDETKPVKQAKRVMPEGDPEDPHSAYYSFYTGKLEEPADADWDDTEAAVQRIRTMKELGKPLCLFVGYMNPHPEYGAEEPWYSMIDRNKVPERVKPEECSGKPFIEEKIRGYQHLQDYPEEQWNELRATYLAQCAKIDEMFHRICEALKEAGEYDNSAIFFFSDHGDFAGDFGLSEKAQNTFEDVLSKVPFLVKPPKGYAEVDAGISGSIVELMDLYATALEMAGVESQHDHFSRSLKPVLGDRTAVIRDYAHCEGGRMPYEWQCDEYHKNGSGGSPKTNLYWPKQMAQTDPVAHAKGTMVTDGHYKYVHRTIGSCELYDLHKDPGERMNLIGDPVYADVIMKLRMHLLDWYQETCDIVPRRFDSRFAPEKMWGMIRGRVSADKKDEVIRLAEEGVDLGVIMSKIR